MNPVRKQTLKYRQKQSGMLEVRYMADYDPSLLTNRELAKELEELALWMEKQDWGSQAPKEIREAVRRLLQNPEAY